MMVGLNNLPPAYNFARRGIKRGEKVNLKIIGLGLIRGTVREIYRSFFVIETPRGYTTTVAHWHLIKCRKTGELGGIGE